MSFKLTNVRLSFPELFEASQVNGQGDFKFRTSFLIDKTRTDLLEALEKGIRAVISAKWGAKEVDKIFKSIRNNPMRFCLRDGDDKDYDGYANHMYISASNKARPLVVDRDLTPLTAQDGRPYSGCYVNATIEFYAYDNNGKGVAASLRGVQFFRDGDAFSGGGVAKTEEFDDLSMIEDAEIVEEESLI